MDGHHILRTIFGLLIAMNLAMCNPDAKRLYDDLMSSYNSLIRPVANNTDRLTVKMGIKLSQLIEVNLRNQIMAVNVWVEQEWFDHKLRWDPEEYGGVTTMYIPAEQIWLPDIVLYNNADGNYEVTIMTKAILHFDGRVVWNPPAIYKSACSIDISYFPFDEQECFMKFGSWTYDGFAVDLRHSREQNGTQLVPIGMDLSEFYLSVEWDIMAVPARRKEIFYSCCIEPYPDITFNVTLRRKTLFYTVNLIIPCVGISSLSFLVFYMPSDSGEKVSLAISILVSMIFFLMVLIETLPVTSIAMPILGQYLIFCLIMIALSVAITISILNFNFRSPSTHRMSPWVRKFFIRTLPKILLMRSPQYKMEAAAKDTDSRDGSFGKGRKYSGSSSPPIRPQEGEMLIHELDPSPDPMSDPILLGLNEDRIGLGHGAGGGGGLFGSNGSPGNFVYPKEIEKAIKDAMFIAQHIDNKDEFESIREEWKYAAMVLDRLFLWIFTLVTILGTAAIFLHAPSLYDNSTPIDVRFSHVARAQLDLPLTPESMDGGMSSMGAIATTQATTTS